MNKIKLLTITLVLSLVYTPGAYAQEMDVQTDDSTTIIAQLEDNCDTIKTTLRRIHTNDALLRVNMGQMYSGLSSQFMARLNSRLAINRINSPELVDITGRFEEQRIEFSKNYTSYESAMSDLINTDCRNQPVKFYAALLKARDERANLSISVRAMNSRVSEYQVGVENLQQSLLGELSADEN